MYSKITDNRWIVTAHNSKQILFNAIGLTCQEVMDKFNSYKGNYNGKIEVQFDTN